MILDRIWLEILTALSSYSTPPPYLLLLICDLIYIFLMLPVIFLDVQASFLVVVLFFKSVLILGDLPLLRPLRPTPVVGWVIRGEDAC